VAADLDRIEQLVRERAPFDISPRGVGFRPDDELSAELRAVADEGERAVPEVQARLEAADPLTALAWLTALRWMDAQAATAAIDRYAERLRRDDPWKGSMPGAREVLLYLGRSSG
jgi:hypothetical protein